MTTRKPHSGKGCYKKPEPPAAPSVFWGGELVRTTEPVQSGNLRIPEGTCFRIDIGVQRVTADAKGMVTLPYPVAQSRTRRWISFPIHSLERVTEAPVVSGESGSIPLQAMYRGGSFDPR